MRRAIPFVLAIVMIAGFAGTARADVIFTIGNVPQTGEMNILFGAPESCSTLPCTLSTAEVDHTGILVDFTSTVNLLYQNAQGQAMITSTTPPNSLSAKEGVLLTDLTFTIPGYTFGDFIMNPLNGQGEATITVVDNAGTPYTYDLGNGQNYLTITTANGQTMTSVTIEVACSGGGTACFSPLGPGFIEFKQPRVSEVVPVPPPPIPEPATMLLLGSGLLGLGAAARRRRK